MPLPSFGTETHCLPPLGGAEGFLLEDPDPNYPFPRKVLVFMSTVRENNLLLPKCPFLSIVYVKNLVKSKL